MNVKNAYNWVRIYMLRFLVDFISDETYLKHWYKLLMGKTLNLSNPQTFNEKIQWLKLYNKKPEYSMLVDKVAVKDHVARVIGNQYVIPTIGVWDTINEIDWDSLPNQFVIKASHDSGGVVVCKDKTQLQKEVVFAKLSGAGEKNYTKFNKEYVYQNVPHRFIAEQYLEDESGYELKDYKIFCFDGVPRFLFVASGRQQNDTRFDFYDMEFNHLPVINGHPNADLPPRKPDNFEEMIQVASKLSKGMPHVRVDLYNVNGKIYFGELTFFHCSGVVPFEPEEWDYIFGEYLKLPAVCD